MKAWSICLFLSLLCLACDEQVEAPSSADMGRVQDSGVDLGSDFDAHVDADPRNTMRDAGVDLSRVNVPSATTTLVAGVAEHTLGFPIGIGTVGYSPGSGARTPFAVSFPGTNAQHTDLTARALVMRYQGEAVVLVRTDSIGIWQDMVRDVQARLREEGRGDLADGLIIGATHTHSSGGRVFDHFIGSVAVGPFLPGMYLRMREGVVRAVLAADAASVEAKVGHTTIQVDNIHKDRRCENGDVSDDTMGLIKVEDADGTLIGLVVNYAMHGTVLTSDDWTLSRDATGAVESGIEARLPSTAMVLYLQSWAGDVAPEAPEAYITDDGHDLRSDFVDLDAIAAAAADAVIPVLTDVQTTATPGLEVVTTAVPLVPELINPDGSFDYYQYGGIYCLPPQENCEAMPRVFTEDDLNCVPIPEMYTVGWTLISAARIGDLGLVTLPGEPLTSIGVALRESALRASGLQDMFVVGYGQGYLSYLMHPDDFWLGGYEAASVLMGPGFGPYLVDRGAQIAGQLSPESEPMNFEPVRLEDEPPLEYPALVDESALGEPVIEVEPSGEDDIISMTWIGGGPIDDSPRVRLETEIDGSWQAVRYPSGGAVHSGGPEIELLLAVEPPYEEALELPERTFRWTARMPSVFSVPPSWGQPQGRYRFMVEGQQSEPYRLESQTFEIEAR